MRLNGLAAVGLGILLGTSTAASAGQHAQQRILESNNQVGIGLIGTNIDYLETDGTGAPFSAEAGNLIGAVLSVSAMEDFGTENMYFSGDFSVQGFNTQYTGAYQGGTFGSVVQDSGATVLREDARIGKGFAFNDAMVTPYLGLGARQWSRVLEGAGGYREDYSHAYAGAGLLVQFSPAPRWVISANGLVGETFGASMTSSDLSTSSMVAQTYDLGSRMMWMAGLSFDYAVTAALHTNLGFEYSDFGYGMSPVSAQDGTLEPDSHTREINAKLGVGYAF